MSGTTDNAKAGSAQEAAVHEIQGTFPNDETLQAALGELESAGYDRTDLSLPEDQPTAGAVAPDEGDGAPTDNQDVRQLRTLGTSMAGYAGAVAVAGATVATGGAAGLAVAAAAAVGAGTAATANVAGRAADAAQVEERNRRGEAGTLILGVRTATSAQADQVTGIMQAAGATHVEAVTSADQALTAGVASAGWTGD